MLSPIRAHVNPSTGPLLSSAAMEVSVAIEILISVMAIMLAIMHMLRTLGY